jgi:signal peptidase I
MEDENKNSNSETFGFELKAVGLFIWDLVKVLIIALVIIVPFRMLVAEPFVVSGSSMVPNFHNRDYLIIDRLSYRLHLPSRGDVIVLRFPKDPSQFYIKRIIGLPGEKVKITQGHVFILNIDYPQGVELTEPYLDSEVKTTSVRSEPVNLGSDEYFVLGDNRPASSDSRAWGILPRGDIVGKVWLTVFSGSRLEFDLFQKPVYN